MNWNRPLAEEVLAFALGEKLDSLSAMAISSAGSEPVDLAASTTCSTMARATRTGPNCSTLGFSALRVEDQARTASLAEKSASSGVSSFVIFVGVDDALRRAASRPEREAAAVLPVGATSGADRRMAASAQVEAAATTKARRSIGTERPAPRTGPSAARTVRTRIKRGCFGADASRPRTAGAIAS